MTKISEEDYRAGCPHDGNGRHFFEPRFSYVKAPQTFGCNPMKWYKIYEYDVCIFCGITTKQINGE